MSESQENCNSQTPSNSCSLRNTKASISDSLVREVNAYSNHLNQILSQYEEVTSYLPISGDNLFEKLRDGVILGYLINHYFPNVIKVESLVRGLDLNLINQQHSKVLYEVNANLNAVVAAAKVVKNLVIVNLGADDFLQCRQDLVLGLLWQIFNTKLTSNISLKASPQLVRLVQDNESLVSLVQLRPEALLLRWFNYHLQKAGSPRNVTNLSKDLVDGELYVRLMSQIAPKLVPEEDVREIMSISQDNKIQRAEKVLQLADRLGCKEFISAYDIVIGHPRLNFAFTATLFNKYIGISLLSDEQVQQLQTRLESLSIEHENQVQKINALEGALLEANTKLAEYEQQIDKITKSKEQELRQQQERFDTLKEELASQYNDSLTSAINSERRIHQDELWELLSRQKEARRQLIGVAGIIKQGLTVEDLERLKVSEAISEDIETDSLIQYIGDLVLLSSRKISQLEIASSALKTSMAHKEKVNEIMGDKIREYTELVINDKKVDPSRRSSLLKRIFAKN